MNTKMMIMNLVLITLTLQKYKPCLGVCSVFVSPSVSKFKKNNNQNVNTFLKKLLIFLMYPLYHLT